MEVGSLINPMNHLHVMGFFFCLFFHPYISYHYMLIIFTKTEDMHVNINKNI